MNILKDKQEEKYSAPPGFVSLTAFILKREEAKANQHNSVSTERLPEPELSSMPSACDLDDSETVKNNLKLQHRPWIIYDRVTDDGERSNSEDAGNDTEPASEVCLPKGVIRGCPECSNCQKVIARWDPEGANRIILEEAPVFHPREEEFHDTLKYVEKLCQKVEPYGFCRVVPPSSWQAPCLFEGKHIWSSSEFSSHVQHVDGLKDPLKRKFPDAWEDGRGNKKRILPPCLLDEHVKGHNPDLDADRYRLMDKFKFETGPPFTVESFKRYADYFKGCYFSKEDEVTDKTVDPSEENIEGEYWRLVERPTNEIEVLCGDNVDTRIFGSGFLVSSESDKISYALEDRQSGWNLSNVARLPGSLLCFESRENSDILVPWLHFGMCFSTLPWKIEEHGMYGLYYLHFGAPRIWYSVPAHYSYKLEAIMKQHYPDLDVRCPQQLHDLASLKFMKISPSKLKSENIPVFRCIQRPNEFILFLPGAYHYGIDCGFSCSESANFAPLDWLPHGWNIVEVYRECRRRPSLSYDELLLKAANEAVHAQWDALLKGKNSSRERRWKDACGKNGILAQTLKFRIKSEARQRDYLTAASRARRMDKHYHAAGRRECFYCHCDLYLSAARCGCKPDLYACLHHSKNLCSCPWSDRIFLFRYRISELDVLLDALEGKTAAFRKWLKEGLGAALGRQIFEEDGNNDNHVKVSSSSFLHASNECQNEVTKKSEEKDVSGTPAGHILSSIAESQKKDRSEAKEKYGPGGKSPTKMRKQAMKSVRMDGPVGKLVQEAKTRILQAVKSSYGDLSDSEDTSSSSSSSSLELDDVGSYLSSLRNYANRGPTNSVSSKPCAAGKSKTSSTSAAAAASMSGLYSENQSEANATAEKVICLSDEE